MASQPATAPAAALEMISFLKALRTVHTSWHPLPAVVDPAGGDPLDQEGPGCGGGNGIFRQAPPADTQGATG